MLILSRKSQEAVVVEGSDRFERLLKITVLEIRGGNVRLGFEAEADVRVHRWEVWERIRDGVVRLHDPTGDPGPPVGG